MHPLTLSAVLAAFQPATAQPPAPPPPPVQPAQDVPDLSRASVVERLRFEASRLVKQLDCADAQRFALVSSFLPFPGERVVWRNQAARRVLTQAEYDALATKDEAAQYEAFKVSEEEFYYTKYGSPLAYARPLNILCHAIGGDKPLQGKKLLDYGYGTIGHLRLLAQIGVHAVGVDVDPVLRALYSGPEDTGKVPGTPLFNEQLPDGSITLIHGRFPADEEVAGRIDGGYDIILSKNTLKNGYIHPEQEVDKRLLVDLGVPPEDFVAQIVKRLNDGGYFMIYNICPAQKPDRYLPWADGRCPFPREMLEAAGLEVLRYNQNDDGPVRDMARALMWDMGDHPMDVAGDLFAQYTLCRKRGEAPAK
jgi:hypothetical protein